MADTSIIHKIIPYLNFNQWLKRLAIQLPKPTNENSIKVSKVFEPMNKKTLL